MNIDMYGLPISVVVEHDVEDPIRKTTIARGVVEYRGMKTEVIVPHSRISELDDTVQFAIDFLVRVVQPTVAVTDAP